MTSMGEELKITLTLSEALAKTNTITGKLTPDVENPDTANIYEYSFTESSDNPTTTIVLTTSTNATPLAGTYKLTNGKINTGSESDLTFSANSITYMAEYVLDEQTKSQEIDVSKDDKKSFTVKFNPAFKQAPKIFPSIDSTKEISCEASNDMKSLKCSPTSINMEEGKNYKIAYQKACEGEKAETGVTVTAVKLTSGSEYIKISQIILLTALILL